jgi:hypothetical protein
MPVLPLDHPEPFVATLGVMLYPGLDDESRLNAKALASHWLGEPISKYFEAGHRLSDKTLMTPACGCCSRAR